MKSWRSGQSCSGEYLKQVCDMLLVISMLLLLTVSEIYGKTGAADASNLQTLGSMLIASGDWIQLIGGLVFSVGTLMIFALFYQTRLIPRWLSGWGFIGAVLYIIANFVSMFGPLHIAPDIGVGNRAPNGPNCHSRNGLCGLVDREGIQSICDRCPVCQNRINEV